MKPLTIRVIKLGGSLLDMAELPQRLSSWLALQPRAVNVLLVGGGPWVEAVREVSHRLGIDDVEAHWLSIDAMRITAREVAHVHSLSTLVTTWEQLQAEIDRSDGGRSLLFDPAHFLRTVEPGQPGGPLPASWDVTSDSIAARVAQTLRASELAILKSTLPALDATFLALAESGYVDRCFPSIARSIPRVRFVNLRANHFPAQSPYDQRHF